MYDWVIWLSIVHYELFSSVDCFYAFDYVCWFIFYDAERSAVYHVFFFNTEEIPHAASHYLDEAC